MTSKFKIESGVQLLARLNKKREIENFYPILYDCGLKYNDVVEISCDTKVGATCLLYDIICELLLLNQPDEEPVGIIFFNTIGHFDIDSFMKTLQKKAIVNLESKQNYTMCSTYINKICDNALNNFFILEIHDATQLYTTIHNMDNFFMHHPNIAMMIFDQLTSFYWSEQGFKITKMDFYVQNLLKMIQKVSKEYRVIIIYTKPAYFNSTKESCNFETCGVTGGLNFKVDLVGTSNQVYEVNVKTLDTYYKKSFIIKDKLIIKWQ